MDVKVAKLMHWTWQSCVVLNALPVILCEILLLAHNHNNLLTNILAIPCMSMVVAPFILTGIPAQVLQRQQWRKLISQSTDTHTPLDIAWSCTHTTHYTHTHTHTHAQTHTHTHTHKHTHTHTNTHTHTHALVHALLLPEKATLAVNMEMVRIRSLNTYLDM